jgi:hypothetical protein
MAGINWCIVMLSVSMMGVVACNTAVKMFIELVPDVPSQLIEEKTTSFFHFFSTPYAK